MYPANGVHAWVLSGPPGGDAGSLQRQHSDGLPGGPRLFFNKAFLFGHFFLPDFQDIAILYQKGRGNLGGVYSISERSSRCCSYCLPCEHLHPGRRDFSAGNLLAKSQNVHAERFAGGQDGVVEPQG